jgi:hypothetical protein
MGDRPPQDEELLAAYNEVFGGGTPAQNLVLQDLTARFGFTHKTTAVAESSHLTYFNEGSRFVLLHIGRMLAMRMEPEQQRIDADKTTGEFNG